MPSAQMRTTALLGEPLTKVRERLGVRLTRGASGEQAIPASGNDELDVL
jgi:hypothetical protein